MLQGIPSSAKETPSWISYVHELIVRQNDVLREEEVFQETLPARQAARVVDIDWPPDSKESRDSTEPDKLEAANDIGIIKQRVRRPLSAARLLTLIRLARTFGSAAAFETQLTDRRLTVLRGFATPELLDVARVVGNLMIPQGWEYLFRPDFDSYAAPAVVVLRPDTHRDKIDIASMNTYAERVAEAMESGLPLVLLVPDEVILPEELRHILPEPIMLAPLSREILRAALDAWHPDANVMGDAALADQLPDQEGIVPRDKQDETPRQSG